MLGKREGKGSLAHIEVTNEVWLYRCFSQQTTCFLGSNRAEERRQVEDKRHRETSEGDAPVRKRVEGRRAVE